MTSEASATRRYLALYLPWLPAERAVADGAAPREGGFVLVEKAKGALRVAAVSPAVAALGLIGLPLADARAREPGLVAVGHLPSADARLLSMLADGCEQLSPLVAIEPPDSIVIDTTGCTARHGEAGLIGAVYRQFLQQGINFTHAFADTPEAAAALARFGGTIGDLPVDALGSEGAVRGLRRAGLKTIGAVAAMPRAALTARFGATVTTRLARLLGEERAPIVPQRPIPEIFVEHRFADPVATIAVVLHFVDALMRQAAGRVAERDQGGRSFSVALFRSDGDVKRLVVETAMPTRDPATIARLLAERIETLSDPLDPGFGYDLIRFAIHETAPLASMQLDFAAKSDSDGSVAVLVDQLAVRLGSGRVRRLVPGDSHLPECASFDGAIAGSPRQWPRAEPGEPPLRPLTLFTPPQRIQVVAEVPDGPPRWFSWRHQRHDVAYAEGPERIAAEWWRSALGRGPTRDYYRLEDNLGRRFWVFRSGLYGAETTYPSWYIHGRFA